MPRLVVSCCTCPPLSPFPLPANSFVIGTAVTSTYTPHRTLRTIICLHIEIYERRRHSLSARREPKPVTVWTSLPAGPIMPGPSQSRTSLRDFFGLWSMVLLGYVGLWKDLRPLSVVELWAVINLKMCQGVCVYHCSVNFLVTGDRGPRAFQ
jgi:hypothetical protein